MSSALVQPTIQATLLAGLSNILAQLIRCYQAQKPLRLDLITLLQFVTFCLLSTPPNLLWQEYLEERYPSKFVDAQGEEKLHKQNTATKFALDQTLGAAVNTLLFIAGIGALRGKDRASILRDCQQDFWPFISSGFKLWPMVSLLNLTVVPVHRRVLVGSVVGLVWGVYVNLMVAG